VVLEVRVERKTAEVGETWGKLLGERQGWGLRIRAQVYASQQLRGGNGSAKRDSGEGNEAFRDGTNREPKCIMMQEDFQSAGPLTTRTRRASDRALHQSWERAPQEQRKGETGEWWVRGSSALAKVSKAGAQAHFGFCHVSTAHSYLPASSTA
jgi:hypothetical protein